MVIMYRAAHRCIHVHACIVNTIRTAEEIDEEEQKKAMRSCSRRECSYVCVCFSVLLLLIPPVCNERIMLMQTIINVHLHARTELCCEGETKSENNLYESVIEHM